MINNSSEKLQKVLARAGLGSRREIERWISEGRVTVNKTLAKLGDRVVARDRIAVDGKPVPLSSTEVKRRVILYYKPAGQVCSRKDPEARPSVFEHLPPLETGRWISVGRLDFNTSGLMLFTNDGELANRLMHPSSHVEREYAVRVLGNVDNAMLSRLQQGVRLEDGIARFEQIVEAGGDGANRWYHVTVKEGRNRLVRRLWESQDVTVSRLMRVRFGKVTLPVGMRQGQWLELPAQKNMF